MDQESRFVIMGATGGIGTAVARRLAGTGARLYLGGRDPEKLAALSGELGWPGVTVEAREPETIEACITRAAEDLGGLDGVVNCIGSLLLKPAHLTTWEEWEETLTVNLSSAFAVVRSSVSALRAGGGGSVVLISSAAARTGMANHEAIAAAKAGVQGLVLAAAASYGSAGIRFNVVAPGLVRTPLVERITGNEKALENSVSMHALKRIGEPRDVASCVAWLLDSEQSWVTGQVFGIDGGLATVRPRG